MDMQRKAHIENNLHDSALNELDFSQEKLTVSDYDWLGKIIQQSSTIESIRLPTITKEDASIVLPILDKATVKNSILVDMEINFSSLDLETSTDLQLIKHQIKSRLQRNQNRIIGIHGGGNIGLGLFADIVSKTSFPYRILATSSNEFLRKLVNSRNKLWLKHENEVGKHCKTMINHLTLISRSSADIVRLYRESCLVALCVTPDVFLKMANDMANALITRHFEDGSGIKILLLMNLPNCDQFVSKIMLDELRKMVSPSVAKTIWSNIEFVPTVIDRMVTRIEADQVKLQLKEQLSHIKVEMLEKIIGEHHIDTILASKELLMKAIKSFNLEFAFFKAEFNFTMYVKDDFIEAYRFPLIRMSDDLKMQETIKSVYINGPHAVLAWLGALIGLNTIAEAIKHPALFSFIKEMMEQEIGPILLKEYPCMTKDELETLEHSFFNRCLASVDDRLTRVGQDPMRKLNSKGRIRYPIELAEKHKLSVSTSRLQQAIAAGFLYGIKKLDPTNPGCQKIRELYEMNEHSMKALLRYSGPAPGGNFIGLTDDRLINNVMNKMTILSRLYDNGFKKKQKIVIQLLYN